ncbi:MAG: hypothetical protein IRY99_08125, partial [Isosphaeraceae bacterium]|nr:hypothetical protein [Isosphaeraceae bacterium]
RRKPAAFQPLSPQSARPLIDHLTGIGMGGLQYFGGLLDKTFGARALRGLAAGDLREALSILPGSDTLGITDPSHAHSMDDLLTGGNALGVKVFNKNDPNKWELRDFLVPALEIAADPGTYIGLPGAALSKAGKAAAKLGKLPKGIQAGIKGFDYLAPELRAAGHADSVIDHLKALGHSVADDDVVEAVAKQGGELRARYRPVAPGTEIDDAARAAGRYIQTPAGMMEVGDATPLRGLLSFGPFGNGAWGTVGHGETARKIAGGIDQAGDFIKYSRPVRQARALFSTPAGRSVDEIAQRAHEFHGMPEVKAQEAAARDLEYRLLEQFQPLAGSAEAEKAGLRAVRQAAEGFPGEATKGLDPEALARAKAMGEQVYGEGLRHIDEAEGIGLPIADARDKYARYAPRHAVEKGGKLQYEGGQMFGVTSGANKHRKSPFRDVPGGTNQIDAWVMNPRLSGKTNAARLPVEEVRAIVHQDMLDNLAQAGVEVTDDVAAEVGKKSKEIAKWLGTVSDVHAAEGIPFYNPNIIQDIKTRGIQHARTMGAARAYHGAVGENARLIDDLLAEGHRAEDLVTVPELYEMAGLKTYATKMPLTEVEEATVRGLGFNGSKEARHLIELADMGDEAAKVAVANIPPELLDRLNAATQKGAVIQGAKALAAKHGIPLDDFIQGRANPREVLGQYALTRPDAEAMTRFMRSWIFPNEVRPVLQQFDGLQNLFKAWTYPLFPASHVRNFLGALYNNWVRGVKWGSYQDFFNAMRGGHLEDQPDLIRRLYKHGIINEGLGNLDLVGEEGAKIGSGITSRLPGSDWSGGGTFLQDVAGLGKEAVGFGQPGAKDVFGVAGVGGGPLDRLLNKFYREPRGLAPITAPRPADTLAPLVVARKVGRNIEEFVRGAQFLDLVRQGYADEVAESIVKRTHFDYKDLTPFEKNVMKRLVPYYTFMRKNLPQQLAMMATRPGTISTPLRVANALRGDGFVPDYIGDGVAVPIGKEADGTQRFLSQSGLPFEEALERLKFTGNLPDLKRTALAYLGTMTPYVKGPLETLFDTQFHTGRKLSDLRPQGAATAFGLFDEDQSRLAAQVIANTPLTRVASTLDKIVDDRKGAGPKALNLLTGFRLSDVDMDKARAIEARNALEEVLDRNPYVSEFTNFYVKPEDMVRLSPEDRVRMQLYALMKERAKAAAEERRERRIGLPAR